MAEDSTCGPAPLSDTDQQHDDVLGKIDQLLNRHRPKTSIAEIVPVVTDARRDEAIRIDDGIPILNDIVGGPGRPTRQTPSPARSSTINSVLILRRLAIALEAEHARIRAQISGDAAQVRMLDQLVAELRRALPAAVRAAITVNTPDSSQSDDDGRL